MITPVALARRCTRIGSAEGRGGRRARLNYQIISSEGATIASTVTDLLPIIAIILGVIVLNESITVLIVAGILLILIGAALTRTREPAGTETAPG
jgi:drug/metabolite transporter (DMT)-like permease